MIVLLISIVFALAVIIVPYYKCRESIKSKNKVHFYVARDRDGGLWIYLGKPFRSNNEFYHSHDKKVFCLTYNLSYFGLKEEDFDFLKWEDEPVEVFLNLED